MFGSHFPQGDTAFQGNTDEKSIQDVFEYLNNRWGKLNILINNAGVFLDERKSVLDLDLDSMRSTMEINL